MSLENYSGLQDLIEEITEYFYFLESQGYASEKQRLIYDSWIDIFHSQGLIHLTPGRWDEFRDLVEEDSEEENSPKPKAFPHILAK